MSARVAKYEPNHKGTAEGMVSMRMQDAMVAITTRKYLPAAILISPRNSGDYSSSFGVDRGTRVLGRRYPTERAAAILYNSAPYSGKVEQSHKVLNQIRDAIRKDNP